MCPNCGSKVNPSDDFCENCGAVLNSSAGSPLIQSTVSSPVASPATASGSITCSNCGTVNNAGEEFCGNCGAALTQTVAVPSASKPIQAAPSINGQPSTGTAGKRISARVSKPITKCPSCSSPINDGDRFCRKCGFNFVGSGLVTSSKISTNTPHFASQTDGGDIELTEGMMLGDNGKYRITKMIGKGGMGAVFLADDTILKRQVVIKALLHSDDADMVAASIKEREFLATVKHPNIVSIYDFFTIGTEGYIVMEFVNGRTLYQLMEKQGKPFDPATAVRHIRDIVAAFSYLHKLDLIYCDFKPQNVMVENLKDGSQTVKLIDLGTVIKYERTPDAVYGTTGFYAPEAVDHPSPQTDLYTICRSLAWMVTWLDLSKPQYGVPPRDAFPVFQANEPLYNLLYRGTHPDPTKRFKGGEELYDQLDGVLRMVEGGRPGVPVISKIFAGGALSQNSRLGSVGYPVLDEGDTAISALTQGDMALRRGDTANAERAYNQAAGMNRNSADASLRLADIFIEQGNFEKARAAIASVQTINSSYRVNMAEPANGPAEIALLRRADLNGWKAAWYNARLQEAQNKLPVAQDQYQGLVRDLPGELIPLLGLGHAQLVLGRLNEALANFYQVIKAEPDNTDAIFGACDALLGLKKYDEAVRVLERVNEMSARFNDARLRICNILLYQKPQSGPDELATVSQSLRRLQQMKVETPEFLLAQAEFYRRAWELAALGKLPGNFTYPDQQNGQSAPSRRVLGKMAEENYRAYLKRDPNAPNREEIVRAKFKVAPWRIL